MTPTPSSAPGGAWGDALRAYVIERRAARPLPDRATLSAADEWRCRIVGGAFIAWLERHGPSFLREREVHRRVLGVDPDPLIVFTSDVPGLVAAAEILGSGSDRIVCLTEPEFDAWVALRPDAGFRHHVHVWSYLRSVLEPDFEAKARAKHPLADGHAYWQHVEGTLWAPLAGRGVDHLWAWDGREPVLLEEAFTSWVT